MSYMRYGQSQISFTDPITNNIWVQSMQAAPVVPMGYQGLPPSKGSVPYMEIQDPGQFGIPEHPLRKIYPNIIVRMYAMLIDLDTMAEQIKGKTAMGYWVNNNGSGASASVTSLFGRSDVAPNYFAQGEDFSVNPKANPYMEWRTVVEGGLPYTWSNGRMHGWPGYNNEFAGRDWLDGCPENVSTMYDPTQGVMRQSVMLPKIYKLGTAQQTMREEDLTNTFSSLLYFPNPSKKKVWDKLVQFSSLMTPAEAIRYVNGGYGTSRGGHSRSVEPALESFGPKSATLGGSFEVTHANQIKQAVCMPFADPTLWQPVPTAVIVGIPINAADAEVLNRPANVPAGRSGLTW